MPKRPHRRAGAASGGSLAPSAVPHSFDLKTLSNASSLVGYLKLGGYRAKLLTPYQIRVEAWNNDYHKLFPTIDLYPKNQRFHVIHTKLRGEYSLPKLKDLLRANKIVPLNTKPRSTSAAMRIPDGFYGKATKPLASRSFSRPRLVALIRVLLSILTGIAIALTFISLFPTN